MVRNHYKLLSEERKKLQEHKLLPEWYSTAGYQLFKEKYLWANTPREQYETIAHTLAAHTDDAPKWKEKFFELLWKGWLSPSTPVLANTGTTRGMPVSCSGGYVADSIDGFYKARREAALLTKHGFGTSGYLGDIRPRGAPISTGGQASGVLPVIQGFIQDSRDVNQGGVRRGAWAGYLPITHGDFDEVTRFLEKNPDDFNVGWNIHDDFVTALDAGDPEAIRRFQRALKVKMVTGKGYFYFPDKSNRALPVYYPIKSKASNLCSEIVLPSDDDHTFTCVLSSMNVAKYDEWKGTTAIFDATVFLDCVASEFISRAKGVPGLEKAVRFTEKARALGLGVCGLHTYLQKQMIPMDSLEALYFNDELFKKLDEESWRASCWMGDTWGIPEWVQNFADNETPSGGWWPRNASRLAVAPTKSTALIMGGISEGINPDQAFTFTQGTAGGEVNRVVPTLLQLMKDRGVYNTKTINDLTAKFGSVQHVDWLDDDEKKVFKTAFELDQNVLIRLASQRAKYIDQWQSLNLFFAKEAAPSYIAQVHRAAFLDENIRGLYYINSKAGVAATQGECSSCD